MFPKKPNTWTLTPAPMLPMYTCPMNLRDARYGASVSAHRRGSAGGDDVKNSKAASAADALEVAADVAEPPRSAARNSRGTISNAKSVTSASLGTP